MTLLFVLSGTLLLILQISHRLIDHVTVFPVDNGAFLLAFGIKHGPALGLRELVAVLLVANILGDGDNISWLDIPALPFQCHSLHNNPH